MSSSLYQGADVHEFHEYDTECPSLGRHWSLELLMSTDSADASKNVPPGPLIKRPVKTLSSMQIDTDDSTDKRPSRYKQPTTLQRSSLGRVSSAAVHAVQFLAADKKAETYG